MDAAFARELAMLKLRKLEDPDYPLVLEPDRDPDEHSWCWVFPFNTAEYYSSQDPLDSVLSGPIVVNKDGSEVWVLATSRPIDELLDEYATRRGYHSPQVSEVWD